MRPIRCIVPLLALLSLLAACAPAVQGSTARTPLPWEPPAQIEVVQGSEIYLGLDRSLDDFGLDPADLSGSFWIPAGVDEETASLEGRVALRDVTVPARWELRLAEVRAHRATESRFGRQTENVSYRIRPVLLLRVPADAELGLNTLRAEIAPRGGRAERFELPVRVRAPAP